MPLSRLQCAYLLGSAAPKRRRATSDGSIDRFEEINDEVRDELRGSAATSRACTRSRTPSRPSATSAHGFIEIRALRRLTCYAAVAGASLLAAMSTRSSSTGVRMACSAPDAHGTQAAHVKRRMC